MERQGSEGDPILRVPLTFRLNSRMTDILALIGAEIASLQSARALIAGAEAAATTVRRGRGRPKGTGKKKRNLSPEGRARIAAAVKGRWAAQKKVAK